MTATVDNSEYKVIESRTNQNILINSFTLRYCSASLVLLVSLRFAIAPYIQLQKRLANRKIEINVMNADNLVAARHCREVRIKSSNLLAGSDASPPFAINTNI